MNTNTLLYGIIGVLLGGIIGYALGQATGDPQLHQMTDDTPAEQIPAMPGPGMGMMNDDMPMMDHSAMMVDSEREFIEGMIPHHQEAVDTAKEVIERGGTTPAIEELVTNIVSAQETEIALMKGWYEDWYGETYQEAADEYQPMMRELEGLSGAELDRVFLEDMIMHHMGAIMMARSVRPYIEHSEVEDLADAIESTQAEEIALMRQLLSGLEE